MSLTDQPNPWIRDNQANVGVTEAEPTVFLILLCRRGIDRAVNRLDDDVGSAAVFGRVVELQVDVRASHYLIDEENPGIGIQVGSGRRRLALVL